MRLWCLKTKKIGKIKDSHLEARQKNHKQGNENFKWCKALEVGFII